MALLAWTAKPVMVDTKWDAWGQFFGLDVGGIGHVVLRVRSAMTISSNAAFPARSPMPLMVHSTWRAPA